MDDIAIFLPDKLQTWIAGEAMKEIGSGYTTEELRRVGLDAMKRCSGELTKSTTHRGQIYYTVDKKLVRLRTNNDRLILTATDGTNPTAKLDLEGCDLVLLVVPRIKRMRGTVEVYLIPLQDIKSAFELSHRDWLKDANTKGSNFTWQLALDAAKPASMGGYAERWLKYRLS